MRLLLVVDVSTTRWWCATLRRPNHQICNLVALGTTRLPTCLDPGARPDGCSVGDEMYAAPGLIVYKAGPSPVQRGERGLRLPVSGVWQIDVVVTGTGRAQVGYHSRALDFYKGQS